MDSENIRKIALEHWEEFEYKPELAKFIQEGLVFGEFATDDHMNIDDIWSVVQQIIIEKQPAIEERNEFTI